MKIKKVDITMNMHEQFVERSTIEKIENFRQYNKNSHYKVKVNIYSKFEEKFSILLHLICNYSMENVFESSKQINELGK